MISKKDKKEEKKNRKQEKQISEMQSKCEEAINGWKRAQADYQNLKKETEKDMSEFRKYANANLLMELLPVFEHFEMAFRALSEEDRQTPWSKGIEHIKNEFEQVLNNQGVQRIECVGKKFDHNLHEAAGEEKDPEKEEGIILKEVKAGYKYHDKVLFCPKVVVNVSDGGQDIEA